MTALVFEQGSVFLRGPSRGCRMVFPVITLTLALILAASVTLGSAPISLDEVAAIITAHDTDSVNGFIIWKIRLPRAIASALGGGYLAVAGLLLQIFFKNPIAGPFILGISSGATLTASFAMITILTLGMTPTPCMGLLSAFVGAFGAMALVTAIGARAKNKMAPIITGLVVGIICHAPTAVLAAFAEKGAIKEFVLWQLGSFSGVRWNEIETMVILGGAVCILVYSMTRAMNAFILGGGPAAGVNIRLFCLVILISASTLAGMVTAVAGPVAFVGIAVPQMARLVFATSDHRILIPGTLLAGAVVTALCDLIARVVFAPVELPVSAITAIFGAPIFIGLVLKRKGAI